ncbi:MAG: helix-turn-helix domain-containing protein [Synergistaceae bacterium]|nr:helix-turn-helix domain-containing protein [Synergistaceae bacterium]
MTDRTTILDSIQSLRAIRQEFTARLDRIEGELLRLLDTMPESTPLPQGNKPEEWLTVREVCKALKISTSTLYERIKDGTLPEGFAFSKRSRRWRMSDILAWQEAKTHDEPKPPEHTMKKRRGRVSRIMKLEDLLRA